MQRAREAEAVQQAEGERHHPGMPDREARLAPPASHDLRTEEEDAERDRRFDRGRRHLGVAERRGGERDAVRQRERRHGLRSASSGLSTISSRPSTNSRWSAPNRMCRMPSTTYVPATPQRVCVGVELDPRLRRARDRRPLAAVEHLDAHQHVGDGQLEPGERDARAGETVRSCVSIARRSTIESASSWLIGSRRVPGAVGELQHDREAHAREDGGAPQHVEASGRGLPDLEIGRARLVGPRTDGESHASTERRERHPKRPARRSRRSLARRVGDLVRTGAARSDFSSGARAASTVYFARISS